MAIIYTYPRKSTAEAGDLVVISDSSDSNKTKQLTLQSIADYIDGEVTLQEVLNTGSRALNQGNSWNGIFRLDDSNPVGSDPQFIVDMNATSGSGSSVVYIVGKLETAIGSDASFGQDVSVARDVSIFNDLTVTRDGTINRNLTIGGSWVDLATASTELRLDSDGGTLGQVIKSNGPGVTPEWVDPASLPAGNVEFEVQLNENNIAVGDPLYIQSNVGGIIIVAKADAGDINKMPAAGIAKQAGGIGDTISMIEVGTLSGTFLGSGVTGDVVYVADGGGLVVGRPVANAVGQRRNLYIQNVGIITRQSGGNDRIQVTCIGRFNALPQTWGLYSMFTSDLYGNPESTSGLLTVVTDSAGGYANSEISIGSNNITYINPAGNTTATGNISTTFLKGYFQTELTRDAQNNIELGAEIFTSLTSNALRNIGIGFNVGNGLVNGDDNVIIGANSYVNSDAGTNVVIGSGAMENMEGADSSVAVGFRALRGSAGGTGDGNVAIGYASMASGGNVDTQYNTAVGYGSLSNAVDPQFTTAIGYEAGRGVTSNYGIFIGNQAGYNYSTNSNGVVIISSYLDGSPPPLTNAQGSVLIGYRIAENLEGGRGNVLIGDLVGTQLGNVFSAPTNEFNVAIGDGAMDNSDNNNENVVIGHDALVDDNVDRAIAIGDNPVAGSSDGIAIGTGSRVATPKSISIGEGALTNGTDLTGRNIAIGYQAQAAGVAQEAIAIGYSSRANVDNGIAIGNNADASTGSTNGVAIGTNAQVTTGSFNVAIGTDSEATAGSNGGAIALGRIAIARAQYAMALGHTTDALVDNGIALGTNAQAVDYPDQINIRNSAGGALPSIQATTGGLPAGVTRNGDIYIVEVDNTQLGGPAGTVKLLAIV